MNDSKKSRKKSLLMILIVAANAFSIIGCHYLITKVFLAPVTASAFILVPVTLVIIPAIVVGLRFISRDSTDSVFKPHRLNPNFSKRKIIAPYFWKHMFLVTVVIIGAMMGFYLILEEGLVLGGISSFMISTLCSFLLYRDLDSIVNRISDAIE